MLIIDRRAFLLCTTATFATSAAGAALLWQPGRLSAPRKQAVRGARTPIEITDDIYGIPHIRAGSIPDAFFGQGYVVARDRLFQIDLQHRQELGRLAEAFGASFTKHDAAARLFHYRGSIDAELSRVPANVLACAQAYVAGINARIDEVVADPAQLPPEYQILKIVPLKWDIRDMVRARDASIGEADDKLRRAQLAALGVLELDAVVAPLSPAWNLTVPDGLDVVAMSASDLGVLNLEKLPFGADHSVPDPAISAARANAGSNAWMVAPSRTATGRPILANDPHLGIGGFGPRHVAHLTAPGLDVIGAGAPGLPGIMQGHTDRFAFGRTNFHIDQTDLFVLELNPDDPERYRHGGVWRRFKQVEETIPVRNGQAERVTLRYSIHGPVVSRDPARRRATVLATISMQPGGDGSFAMIAINLAKDWPSLRKAFPLHPSPTNFHYADIDGNIGWQVIGFMPIRKRGDGLMPAPGDGRYDWNGRRDFASMPNSYNPNKGWFASANQNNLPANWLRDRIPAFSFHEPYRYERIADVLSRDHRHSLADSVALQHDTLSTPARQFLSLLPQRPSENAAAAVAMLRRWDARIAADSGPAALFELAWREIGDRLLAALVPTRAKKLVKDIAPSVVLNILAQPDARLGANPHGTRDAMLDAALASAWDAAHQLLGPDPVKWRYGTLHQVKIRHPLSAIPKIAATFPAVEGAESGGDNYTVMARSLSKGLGWRVGGGASYLQVIDVGKWDNSLTLNLPGQSLDPRSPHYRDQYLPWISGRLQPMPFSPAAIAASAAVRTILQPG